MAGETKEQQDAAQGDVAAKPKPMTEAEVEELPKTIVRRLVKDKLAQIAGAGANGEGGAEVIVNKDAMAAFSESARIFIHYLSATANDMCKDAKRQTINAEDVFKALDEIDFPEFVEPLRTSLEEPKTRPGSQQRPKSKLRRKGNWRMSQLLKRSKTVQLMKPTPTPMRISIRPW